MLSQLFMPPPRDDHHQLLAVVRSVRRRWRLRKVLRGVALSVLAVALLWLLGGYAIDASRFDAAVVGLVRVLAYGLLAVAVCWLVGRPLLRRVSDEQVALYLEEHEPDLGGRLVSALEWVPPQASPSQSAGTSAALIERVVHSAVEGCRQVEGGKRVERVGLWQSSGLVAGTTAFSFALFLAGPAFLQTTLPVLLDPWQEPRVLNPYSILVEPGDVALAEGADLEVTARLEGFDAADVELVVRRDDAWERFSMLRDAAGDSAPVHSLILFELREATEYFVEASGVRSATHRVTVSELPYVEAIHLTLHFPSYTGLEPIEQADSGDLAALVGTEVRLRITSTLAVTGGVIEIEREKGADQSTEDEAPGEGVRRRIPLTLSDESALEDTILSGSITVGEAGVYRILLDSPAAEGQQIVASPDYLIDPLADQPPTLRLTRPGRDIQVTALEEVVTEIQAQDDYGVSRLELVTSVNGGDEQTVRLYRGEPGRKDFVGSHTLFLEEYELQPGDLVSYYARAEDAAGKDSIGGHTVVSDIYFLEIRPFDRNFRQAESGGGGQQGMSGEELTAQQRLILSATFKLARQRGESKAGPRDAGRADDLTTVALSQGRLREDVTALVGQLHSRGVVPGGDSPVAIMAELLPKAAEEMALAEEALGERRPVEALAPEQRALRWLQRAEAAFRDLQVTRGEEGGGGGGRGEISEELADLFEMDLDRLGNQYEQVQRGKKASVDDSVDETLEKLRELARRQQQENERMRARAQQGQDAQAGGTGRSQRQLADEAEEAARKLERLARQESLPELVETAQALRRAAEEMRRAAAAGERSGEALGTSALEQLRQARRQLERDKSGRLERDTRRALERTQRLRQQQERMVARVNRLDPDDPSQAESLQSMMETKERMGAEVGDLETSLDQLARESRRDQPEAARRLQAAAGEIRDRKIREKILYSRGVVQQRSRDYARNFEEDIAGALGDLEQALTEAGGSFGESREQRLEQALEETREVTTALESVEERLRTGDEPPQTSERGGGQPADDASARPGAGAPDGPGRPQDTLRQLQRELGQRRSQLQGLRDRLEQEGVDAEDLERIIGRLGSLGSGPLRAPENLAILENEIVQGLKEFEYDLRRELTVDKDQRLIQAAEGEVPDGYEEMVDRYYKALAGERP